MAAEYRGANAENHISVGQTRNVVWTANNYSPELVNLLIDTLKNWEAVNYFVFGREVAPTTGTPHLQGYLELKAPKQWTTIRNKLKVVYLPTSTSAPWTTRRRGSAKQASDYCKKEDPDFVEFGTISNQGERTDLKGLCEDIKTGKRTPDDILEEEPDMYHKYGRTLEKLYTKSQRRNYRKWMTEGIWYFGPSGIGKTKKAMEDYDIDTHYVKCLDDQWWDGYKGQEIVIFNEFRGQIKFSELLDLCDRYPKTVKIRHQEPVQFLAKKIIVTCTKHPKDLFASVLSDDEPWAQFARRFQIVDLEQVANEANDN